jgi:hypothetical protein
MQHICDIARSTKLYTGDRRSTPHQSDHSISYSINWTSCHDDGERLGVVVAAADVASRYPRRGSALLQLEEYSCSSSAL